MLKADQPQPTGLQALLKDWGIDADNDIVLDVSGMGRLLGTDESVPVAASYPSHPITENFNLMTAYPLARSMTPIEGGVNGHTAQRLVETSREQLGRNQPQEPDRRPAREDGRRRQEGAGVAGRRGVGAGHRARRRRRTRRKPGTRRSRPRRGSSRSATRTSRATARSASRATATCS